MGRSPRPTDGSHPHDDRPDLERLDPAIGLTAGALLDPRSCQACSRPWTTRSDLETQSASPEGQHHYLLGGLARAAERSGLVLGPSQTYDYVVPPILGGAFAVENITVADFAVTARAPTKRPNKPPDNPTPRVCFRRHQMVADASTCRSGRLAAPRSASFWRVVPTTDAATAIHLAPGQCAGVPTELRVLTCPSSGLGAQ